MTKAYSIGEVKKWINKYEETLSFAEVSKYFDIPIGTIHRSMNRYKERLGIRFKDEVQKELMLDGKRMCLPASGCGEIKETAEFNFRNDSQRYTEQCKSCKKKYCNGWYENNKEYANKQTRAYAKANRKKISAQEKARQKVDINFKLTKRLRTRLWCALKGSQKKGSAISDLGCTIDELKKYLELQFQPNMSWENYGEWHIDHVAPISSFDLTDHDQVKQACHYTNLQPLWAADNISKGARSSNEYTR